MSARVELRAIRAIGSVGRPRSDGRGRDVYAVTPVILSVIGVGLLWLSPRASLFVAALLFGYTQIGGRCGAAHVNTMKMLSVYRPALWPRALAAYSMAGLLSSIGVGWVLGLVGSLVPTSGVTKSVLFTAFATTLTLREA